MDRKGLMQNNLIKRIAVAAALMAVSFFALCIDVNHLLSDVEVAAADEFVITDNTCTINSADDLVAFSKSYQNYPANYQNVSIYIAIASGTLSDLDEFISIGTADYPFAGSVISGSSDLNITLDKPLFSYVTDSVEIKDSGGNIKNLVLSRSVSADTPLFAENVVHDNADADGAHWKITAAAYTDSDDVEHAYSFSGFIGSLGQDAVVSLDLCNNSITSGGGYADIVSDETVGLAVQNMAGGSSLNVSVSGTNTAYNVTSTGGNAGGLVGAMADGAKLGVKGSFHSDGVISAKSYAGGLVGRAKNAQITFEDDSAIELTVCAGAGTGGVFGYYSNTGADVVFSGYNVSCILNGANAGGMFGELSNSGTMTIDGTNNVTAGRTSIDSTYKKNLGGIIGSYLPEAAESELRLNGLTINVGKSASADNYGGVIGEVSDGAYGNNYGFVRFTDVTVNAGSCKDNINTSFGGLVGSSAKSFLDAENVTIVTDGGFIGGGVVGNMKSGVLRLSGKTDLSGAAAGHTDQRGCGQIVGGREQALIYARDGWKLIRSAAVAVDDIGTWGEVLRFNSVTMPEDSVLTVNETAHTVTVAAAAASVSGISEFAALALNIQLNSADAGSLLFDPGSVSSDLLSSVITLAADIDLTGTGITGLTRDDGSNGGFTGTLNGGGHKITLAIGEAYGMRLNESTPVTASENGNGIIYRHRFNGLFATTESGAAFNDIVIDGNINVNAIKSADVYAGGLSAEHLMGALSFTAVTAVEKIALSGGNKYIIVGGILGRTIENTPDLSITLKDSTIGCEITCSGNCKYIVGGAIGEISTVKSFAVTAENTTFSAAVTNRSTESGAKAGCFLSNISNYSNSYNTGARTLTLKNILVDGARVLTNSANDGGGLLGEAWNNTEVTIGDSSPASGLTVRNSTVSADGSGNFGGIITAATGFWRVYDVDVESITVEGASAQSFGMLINKGIYTDYSKTFALYLELESENAFKISSADLTVLKSSAVYDELLATCTDNYSSDVCENNKAVVSVHTSGEAVKMNGAECSTYQNQSGRNVVNKNTRYYYNLDVIRGKAESELTAPEKLMLWSVYNYAYDNIRQYFTNPITSANNSIPAGNYDMTGYSYYPIDMSSAVSIAQGSSFVFCNEEIESGESGAGDSDGMKRSVIDNNSQHYLMHGGLFRNVTGEITLDGAEFSGNVGNVGGSGALICGTLSGTLDYPAVLVIQGLMLNGVRVNDLSSGYAPLLINNIGSNANVTINSVSTARNAYSDAAATSLIGNAGNSDAENISLTFSGISLDGRKTAGTYSDLDGAYGTGCSIFSKALLLNSLIYQSGKNCSAVYNFRYNEDWNSGGTALHHVAYGSEISDSAEYPDKQRQYIDSDYYTSPEQAECAAAFSFSQFRPYVAEPFDEAANYHEIKVNHKNTANLDRGCGTYNDPYIISVGDQLALVADILNGVMPASDGVIINYYPDNYSSWCENRTSHTEYVWNAGSSVFSAADGSELSVSEMQTVLATAYYRLEKDLLLPGSFVGLGRTVAFKGVIYGADNTIVSRNSNPFIYQSKGAVVKDLTVHVTADFSTALKSVGNSKYLTDGDGKTEFYGGVIGIVNGGDNIIDNVRVVFDNADTIDPCQGSCYGNKAVGGYVGVLRYGGVIFRNMEAGDTGLAANRYCAPAADANSVGNQKTMLYCNPIIGRVIDGYAVNETAAFEGNESAVTLHNGVRNYSIADIDVNLTGITFSNYVHPSGRSSINESTVTIPNSQSLLIMGCIAMSGAGSAAINGAYPSGYSYGNEQMVRHAEYSMIGSDDRTDFTLAQTDNYGNSASTVPYLIYKYTSAEVVGADGTTAVSYPARSITNNNCVYNIVLAGGTYDVPDGFRGIGSLNSSSDDLEMYVNGIDGNGAVINLNMNFYVYRNDYEQYYKINSNQNYRTGLGLFNELIQNKSSVTPTGFADDTTGKYTIHNLVISGSVNYQVLYSEAGAIASENKSYFSVAGGLAGVASPSASACAPQVENVQLVDLNVNAKQVSGGLFGASYAGNVTIKNCGAQNLYAGGGIWAGGLIGFSKSAALLVDGSTQSGGNSVFSDLTVTTLINSTGGYNNDVGTGGLFGSILSDKQLAVEIRNLDITGGSVSSSFSGSFLGGVVGLVGSQNKSNLITFSVDNVNCRNLDVNKGKSTTNFTGGIIGTLKAGTKTARISNTHISGQAGGDNTIRGYMQAGGIAGLVLCDLTADNCSVENYTLYGGSGCETVGGFFAKTENAKTVLLTNSRISDCIIQQCDKNKPAGGVVGHNTVNMKVQGYNILVDNVQLTDANGNSLSTDAYAGDISGYIQSGSVSLVGVSLLKTDDGKYMGREVGTNNGSSYVIYADHDGRCLEAGANTTSPTFNNAADAADMGAYPYVTVNPAVNLLGDDVITGDGISGTAVTNIINEILTGSAKAYFNVTASEAATFQGYISKMSDFKAKTNSDIVTDAQNFPVLVINDSNYSHITEMINSYAHLLTNNVSIANYANADSGKCNVDISSYRLTESGFTKQADVTTLEIKNGYFRMSDTEYDSLYDLQFTLIDIQYYAPNDTSRVAYHLYIPVYVEKMLKFDFTVGALSGTQYNTGLYTLGNPVLESYGTPVTAYFTYSYLRTPQEWQDAINGGEDMMKGYGKTVLLSGNNDLPGNTRLVLVDRSNYSKAYYGKIETAFDSVNKTLDLSRFQTSDGAAAFSPVSFCTLLSRSADITASPDENGTLVKCSGDISAATIKAGGEYFRKKTDSDTDTSAFYSITVTPKAGMTDGAGILKVSEEYYISFFTEADNDQPMRNITISCRTRLGDDGMIPSRLNNAKSELSNVHMILGNLYNQQFTFETTGDEVINENNNTITANMKTVITLKPENADDIKAYLKYRSIHLFHGFVIEAARTDEDGTQKGVMGNPQVRGTYTIGETDYPISRNITDSVIILCGNESQESIADIKQYLINNNSVTITCNNLKIVYADEAGIIEQFPERQSEDSTYGVVYSANSNLAYVQDNIGQNNSAATPDGKNYYRENIAAVSLIYNIPSDSPDEMTKIGINGREVNGEITAIGYYNVLNVPEEDLNNASSIKFTLYLYKKNEDETYSSVDIDEYLRDVKLEKRAGTLVTGNGTNVYDFVFGKDELSFEAGSYEVTSTYSVLTGEEFENDCKVYANYKVQLAVQMLDSSGNSIVNSGCSDYIIYTNAKICTNMIS